MSESFSDKLKVFRAGIDEMTVNRARELRLVNSSEAILANNSFWSKLMKGMIRQLTDAMMKEHHSKYAYRIAVIGADLMQRVDLLEREIKELVDAGKCGGKGPVLALQENQRWTEAARSLSDTLERIYQQVTEYETVEDS